MPFSWRHFFLLVASPVAGAALVSSACRLPGRGTAQRCARALPIVAVEAGTVDLRRKRPEEPGRDAPSYGQDPRPGQGFDAAENWAGPPPAGSLGTLSSVPELNSAIAGGQPAFAFSLRVLLRWRRPPRRSSERRSSERLYRT